MWVEDMEKIWNWMVMVRKKDKRAYAF